MSSRHRLRGRRRFAAVRATGVRASSDGVRAQLAGNDLGVARVGFAVVGLRSAVQRNRVRRRLREAVRPELERLAGHDLVLVAGATALALPHSGLRQAVATATATALDRSRRALATAATDNGPMTAAVEPAP